MSVTTSVCTLTTHVECSRQNATTPCSCSLHVKISPLPTAARFTSKCLHSPQLFASRQNVPTPYSCSLHVKMPPLSTVVRFTSKCLHSLQLFACVVHCARSPSGGGGGGICKAEMWANKLLVLLKGYAYCQKRLFWDCLGVKRNVTDLRVDWGQVDDSTCVAYVLFFMLAWFRWTRQ